MVTRELGGLIPTLAFVSLFVLECIFRHHEVPGGRPSPGSDRAVAAQLSWKIHFS